MNDFLSEVDVSQWMLYHMDVAAARFGRGLVVGKIYDCNGNLLVVCVSLFFFLDGCHVQIHQRGVFV